MTTSTSPASHQIKDQHRAMWAAGRYADVAEHVGDIPPAHLLLARRHRAAATPCSTSPPAPATSRSAAARLGARRHRPRPRARRSSTSPARGRTRCISTSHWIEGDAEALPFADATFDRVLSRVRRPVRPAPRGRRRRARCASAAPAARSASSTGRPTGLIGRCSRSSARTAHAARLRLPAAAVGRRGARALAVPRLRGRRSSAATNPFVFPSVDAYMTFFEERYGPTLKAKERLIGRRAAGRRAAPRCASSTRR